MRNSLKNTLLNLHTSSFHLTPALKTRSSVYLRITLEFVKNAHSVGVGLSSRTACSPADYGFLWRWSVSYALRNYFNIEVGNRGFAWALHFSWFSFSISNQSVPQIPFPNSPSASRQDQPVQGRAMIGCGPQITSHVLTPQSHPALPFKVAHLLMMVLEWLSIPLRSLMSTGLSLIFLQVFGPRSTTTTQEWVSSEVTMETIFMKNNYRNWGVEFREDFDAVW